MYLGENFESDLIQIRAGKHVPVESFKTRFIYDWRNDVEKKPADSFQDSCFQSN